MFSPELPLEKENRSPLKLRGYSLRRKHTKRLLVQLGRPFDRDQELWSACEDCKSEEWGIGIMPEFWLKFGITYV
jgi:hypothetical protein